MANLALDDRKPRMLTVDRPAVIPHSLMSDADCRNAGSGYQPFGTPGAGVCLYSSRTLYPLALPAGSHRLRFSLKTKDPGVAGELACQAGETSFATLGGKFMTCTGGGAKPSASAETLSLGQEPSPGPEPRVIVYDNGEWLYPQVPAPP